MKKKFVFNVHIILKKGGILLKNLYFVNNSTKGTYNMQKLKHLAVFKILKC